MSEGWVAQRLRSVQRRVRGSKPGRWVWRRNLRVAPRAPWWFLEAQCRFAIYDMATADERRRSVDALTELFFDLVEAAAVRRFVEAGAKDASASVRAAALPGVETVVAFEANPYTHRRFAAGLENARVDYRHAAVSERTGTDTFMVRRRVDGTPIADGQGSLLVRPDHEPGYEQIEVQTVSLDELFHAPEGVRTALWIDVEGAASVVLRGAAQLLGDVDVMMVEVEERAVWKGQQWLRRDVVAALRRSGLEVVARDRQSRYQFNIVFLRADHLRTNWFRDARRNWQREL